MKILAIFNAGAYSYLTDPPEPRIVLDYSVPLLVGFTDKMVFQIRDFDEK